MFKQDLTFSSPYMNAAGTLGFAPDFRAPVPWESFGAFVTNPLSLRPRLPTASPALIEYPGLPEYGLKLVADQKIRPSLGGLAPANYRPFDGRPPG